MRGNFIRHDGCRSGRFSTLLPARKRPIDAGSRAALSETPKGRGLPERCRASESAGGIIQRIGRGFDLIGIGLDCHGDFE